ncbi:MAG TPA: hypothetical protein VF734_09240 [Pseudonocardiaceae bacterium]
MPDIMRTLGRQIGGPYTVALLVGDLAGSDIGFTGTAAFLDQLVLAFASRLAARLPRQIFVVVRREGTVAATGLLLASGVDVWLPRVASTRHFRSLLCHNRLLYPSTWWT